MTECFWCGIECDKSIGMYHELKTEYWGGRRNGNVEYGPKLISFFCSDNHRNDHIEYNQQWNTHPGITGGVRYPRRTDLVEGE